MKAHFICLANSKKWQERCIAGIRLSLRPDKNFDVFEEKGKPKWIRPVSHSEHGEVSEAFVRNINLLDIVETEIVKECPSGYQCENVFVKEKSFKVIRKAKLEKNNISRLVTKNVNLIYGSNEKSVSVSEAEKTDYSLIFVKPKSPSFIKVRNRYVKDQLRTEFTFKDVSYNLPVTDLNFLKAVLSKTGVY
ncbi:MAG TPA: hypothetical protein VJ455_11165 [Ignavibacteria bacterium]|nr:hypothetical protein [Ignavibacteria bacterium]